MAQYLSPGVYVEETASGAAPIAGVGTSTAGFIGIVSDEVVMPVQLGRFEVDAETGDVQLDENNQPVPLRHDVSEAGEPVLLTSWEQFKNRFGDFQEGNKILAHAVYGFFNNGGTRCHVIRVAGSLTVSAVNQALRAFETVDDISIVAVPGVTDKGVLGALIDHCESTGDRFAILDGQRTRTLTPSAITGGVRDSDYAALYYPWISVFDPVSGAEDFVPPSGHMAGIYARVDARRGVHKAPANETIRGALGVETRLGRADQDGLNPAGVNVIRQFNANITVWGARTLGGDANGEWKYVSVRRLFLFMRKSIEQGTQWVVFEPNTPELWAKIRRNVTAFLTNVWRAGALFGTTEEQAFFVKCDADTNPPESRDLGRVVTEIGVCVVKPAEFVIFRVSQWAGPSGG